MFIILIVFAIIGMIWVVCLGCLSALVVFFSVGEYKRRQRKQVLSKVPIGLTVEDERWLEQLLERTG